MITFKSPATSKKRWKLYLKSPKEMLDIYYEDTEPEDGYSVHGITEYATSTIYINKNIDGFLLLKTIRHELMHVYLWDLEKNGTFYTDEEVSEIIGISAPLICKTADEILSKIRNGGNCDE